ncbi:MAG: hypothetical protein RLZZ568_1650 [Cyanobacteriota bacterium]|jgi:hypothetical protein
MTLIPLRSEILCYQNLPLAVYREIAAHLQQVEGVVTELLPATERQFDYAHSQVGGLQMRVPEDLGIGDRQQITAIIEFYAAKYGHPQRSHVAVAAR